MNNSMKVKSKYEIWLTIARQYYHDHGDLLVPGEYVTPDGHKLGRWIERQRAKYNGKIAPPLYPQEIADLEAIGMVWKLENRYPWDSWLDEATKYYVANGDLAVPKDYITDGGHALGNWIGEMRKKYAGNKLDEYKIGQLEKIGMIWSFRTHRSFTDWYKDALDYYLENGDLHVTTFYTTKNGDRLGQWISIQRAKYSGRIGLTPLTNKQIELLNTIDMVWDIRNVRESQWELIYCDVMKYKETNNKLPLWPVSLKASNGVSMPRWITYQRNMLEKDRLSADKRLKLREIGII